MLDVEPKENRTPRSFTLKPSTIAMIEDLADAYQTNASRIMETLVTQYGPKILAERQRKGEKQ